MGVFTNTFSNSLVQVGSLLNPLINLFGFWSKEDDGDYYASLEDESPYFSLIEKE